MTDIATITDAPQADDTTVIGLRSLSQIGSSIREGHMRAERGGNEWLQGSLIVATNLYMARGRFASDNEFGKWLKDNGYDYYKKNDRAALIAMGSDVPTMREVLNNTPTKSYRLIYREHKNRFPKTGKPRHSPRKTERRMSKRATKEMKLAIRMQTLGEPVAQRIANTSLGELAEMEALIELRRRSPEEAELLIKFAEEGKAVSAIAVVATKKKLRAVTGEELIEAFKHSRLLRVWLQTNGDGCRALIKYLEQNLADRGA